MKLMNPVPAEIDNRKMYFDENKNRERVATIHLCYHPYTVLVVVCLSILSFALSTLAMNMHTLYYLKTSPFFVTIMLLFLNQFIPREAAML